jgi:putative Mg2+ transporter-C (MgtC) family protein
MDNFHEDITKLLISLLIGSIVGAEREYRSKSAGFRTLILVCVGSTLFTIFSIRIGVGNPDRIAANIITGIGFLGAGAIFRGETGVSGLTTATMIWMSAALGMGVGAGEYVICCVATAVIIVILIIFPRFERLIDESHQNRTYKIICLFDETILSQYEIMFKEFGLKQKIGKKIRRADRIIGIWELQGSLKKHELLTNKLLLDTNIIEFEF